MIACLLDIALFVEKVQLLRIAATSRRAVCCAQLTSRTAELVGRNLDRINAAGVHAREYFVADLFGTIQVTLQYVHVHLSTS